MTTQIFSDWKKKASQISARNTNKDQQEQAFMNLAYGYVSQKAGRLMEDPHRLGFEIIYSNDDCSKMAGMFAFRVGRTLISVPAIYINNDVKGTEIMYEHDTKLVRPLSVEWSDYIISKYHGKEAVPEEKGITSKMTSGMQLDRIATPRFFKQASAWEAVFEDLEARTDDMPNILQDFLLDAGQSGMQKLAHAIEQSVDFAQALTGLDEDIYMPPAPIVKQAAAKTPDLEFYFRHFPLTKMSAEENDKAHERGWFMWENRPDTDLSPVVMDAEALVSEITEPGLYDIITTDNDSVRAWVLNDAAHKDELCCGSSYMESPRHGSSDKILVFEDGTSDRNYHVIWGEAAEGETGNTWRWADAGIPDKPASGKAYYALDGGNAYGPYKIKSVRTREDGVTVLKAERRYSDEEDTHYINPDFNGIQVNDGESDVFGDGILWLEVKTEAYEHGGGFKVKNSTKKPGNKEHLLHFLAGNSIKKITVEKEPDGPNFRVLENEEPVWDEVDGPNCCTKVASAYSIHARDAMALVDTARKEGRVSAWVELGIVKSAAQAQDTTMQILNSPNYTTGYDTDLRVNAEYPQNFQLDSATTQPAPPPRHFGDAYDPTLGTSPGNQDAYNYVSEEAQAAGLKDSDIFDNSPEDIAQMYTGSNIPNLFQHGTVGMLVSTYDSANMIQKYIPKLEEGLDHFGRILFLFYWKPQDFEKLYGADDLANLEQEILSQFKSFGDILLQLIKKNETKTGSVPTP
jgi:hypothetical protein